MVEMTNKKYRDKANVQEADVAVWEAAGWQRVKTVKKDEKKDSE